MHQNHGPVPFHPTFTNYFLTHISRIFEKVGHGRKSFGKLLGIHSRPPILPAITFSFEDTFFAAQILANFPSNSAVTNSFFVNPLTESRPICVCMCKLLLNCGKTLVDVEQNGSAERQHPLNSGPCSGKPVQRRGHVEGGGAGMGQHRGNRKQPTRHGRDSPGAHGGHPIGEVKLC